LPTGAIADLIGKKKAIFLGCLLNAVVFTSIGLMNLPYQFYIIAVIAGIAFSFNSGADVALLYDSVKKIGKKKDYKKIRGKINTFNQIASIIGVFLGPLIFVFNNRLGFLITGGIYLIASMIMATIKEPYPQKSKLNFKSHWTQTIKGLKFTINHKKIMWLIAFFFVANIGIEWFYDFWQQPLLVNKGINVGIFGIIFASMLGIRGLVSWYTHKIENRLKEKNSLIMILVFQVIIFFSLALNIPWLMFLSFAVLYGVIAFNEIIFEDYINSHISSDKRATVLSIKSLIYNLMLAGLVVLMGYFMDLYSINNVLFGVSGFILIGTIVLFKFKK